jgi:HD-GYP domain-containing protein (c-di-GMP phosphodiesterase class II)
MTSRNSYQLPRPNEEAAKKLREGAGSQFDEALIGRFLTALPQIVTS